MCILALIYSGNSARKDADIGRGVSERTVEGDEALFSFELKKDSNGISQVQDISGH